MRFQIHNVPLLPFSRGICVPQPGSGIGHNPQIVHMSPGVGEALGLHQQGASCGCCCVATGRGSVLLLWKTQTLGCDTVRIAGTSFANTLRSLTSLFWPNTVVLAQTATWIPSNSRYSRIPYSNEGVTTPVFSHLLFDYLLCKWAEPSPKCRLLTNPHPIYPGNKMGSTGFASAKQAPKLPIIVLTFFFFNINPTRRIQDLQSSFITYISITLHYWYFLCNYLWIQ